jgi:hypothetical protein
MLLIHAIDARMPWFTRVTDSARSIFSSTAASHKLYSRLYRRSMFTIKDAEAIRYDGRAVNSYNSYDMVCIYIPISYRPLDRVMHMLNGQR